MQGYSDIRSSRSPAPPPPSQQQTYGGLPSITPAQQPSSYYGSPMLDHHATASTPFPGYLPHEHTLGFGYERYPQSDLRLPLSGGTGREDVQYGHPLPPGLLGLDAPGTSYGSQQSVLSSSGPSGLAGPSSLAGPGSSMAPSSQGSLLGASSDPLGFPSSYEYASDPEPLGTLRAVGSTPKPVGVIGTPRGSSSAGGSSGRKADDDDEGKPSKKRKVEIACNFCRQRKLKCSGTKPACDACMKRDQAERCQYEAFPRRRGPGKAPRGTRRTTHRSRGTTSEAQSQGFGIMSPALSEAGPSSSQSRVQPAPSQSSYGQPHHGPSFVQMPGPGQGYGQPRMGPSSQGQTPGPSSFGVYAPLPAPGYTLPSPIAPPTLGPYGGMSAPGQSGEEQRRRVEQQRRQQQQQYEEEQRQFKQEPHGY